MSDTATPESEAVWETITLATKDGQQIVTEVCRPATGRNFPAVVLGAEATGINRFIRTVASRLAGLGYLSVIPDFLRGEGPEDPDDYDDLDEVRRLIQTIDFRRATFDVLAGVDYARARDDVDSGNVAVWGYCTGGTLTMLAACLDRELSAAVLFYPSQVVFESLEDRRPCHPMDMAWAITCPTVLFCGDADRIYPPAIRDELARRFATWDIDAELVVYPGANHVFAGTMPQRYRQDYDVASWGVATDLLRRVRSHEHRGDE
jgi:carboxymethylenebutenolidase